MILYSIVLLLGITHFLSIAFAQKPDFNDLLSDLGSFQEGPDLRKALASIYDSLLDFRSISHIEAMPDSTMQDSTFSTAGIPVNNTAMMIMVQGLLSRQEVLLEYFPTDTLIFLLVITRESAEILVLKTCLDFRLKVKLFLKRISLADFGDYRKQSEMISNVLLGNVLKKLKGKTKTIIIAHSFLNGFPFEVLAFPDRRSASLKFKSKYLVEEREIVYDNSIFQWMNSRMRRKISEVTPPAEKKLAFVGFSPGFEFHECIQELHDADKEISQIGKMFRERGISPLVLLDENSNENNFRSVARISHILHIATHSLSNDDFPETNGLVFYEFGSDHNIGNNEDGLLAVHEICDLQIPADLIVLNSCASAKIKSRVGMNWFSCPDCFMKAGARNVLCTLWNVTDRFAEKFMVEFYRNYLSGMSFSKALQKVKINMINDTSTSLPVNWAAYVLIGE